MSQRRTRLFSLRLWQADAGDGQVEWRGKIRSVDSGDVHYFRDWSVLIAQLLAMLSDLEPVSPGQATEGRPCGDS